MANNQVLYQDAFDNVSADVIYTYKKSGIEQDVIIKAQLPPPESFGFDSGSAKLEVITEMIDAPTPTISQETDGGGGFVDEDIAWGKTHIWHGRAFDLTGQKGPEGIQVEKRYLNSQGRQVLLELVPVKAVQASLKQLPLQSSVQVPRPAIASLQADIIPPARKYFASLDSAN
jgi:hypothetical protein